MAKILDELGKNKIVSDKTPCFLQKDLDNKPTGIFKLEYLTQKQILENQTYVTNLEIAKEKAEKQKNELLKAEEEKKEKDLYKQKVLKAFDYFIRDFKDGLLDYSIEEYQNVLDWYKKYIKDNDIEIISLLEKYL